MIRAAVSLASVGDLAVWAVAGQQTLVTEQQGGYVPLIELD